MSTEDLKEIEKKLEEHEERISKLEERIPGPQEPPMETPAGIEQLTKKAEVPKECIERIYDIETETLTLTTVIGSDEKEKVQNTTMLVLLGYAHLFGKKDLLAKELRRNATENRIPINNFSRHLNKIIPSLVRRKGKLRSPKTTYRLTVSGERKAKDLLKELCEDSK